MAAIDDSAKLANTSVGEEAQMLCKLLMASLGELGFAHGERRTMRLKDSATAARDTLRLQQLR